MLLFLINFFPKHGSLLMAVPTTTVTYDFGNKDTALASYIKPGEKEKLSSKHHAEFT